MPPLSPRKSGSPFSLGVELSAALKSRHFAQSIAKGRERIGDIPGGDLRALYLQDEVLRLKEELTETRRSNSAQFVAALGAIQRMSEQLFPGPVTLEYARDPEDPSNEYVVFDVVADGEFKDYREREFQWHGEVEKIAPGVLTEFRLCVHPKP